LSGRSLRVFIGRDFVVIFPSSVQVISYCFYVIFVSLQDCHFIVVSLKKVKLYFLVNLGACTSKISSDFTFCFSPSRITSCSPSEEFLSN